MFCDFKSVVTGTKVHRFVSDSLLTLTGQCVVHPISDLKI